MKSFGSFQLVVPAHEVVQEQSPTETFLATLGLSTKELLEMFLRTWVQFKGPNRYPNFVEDGSSQRSHYRMSAHLLVMDILFDVLERRHESGISPALAARDRRDAERVMMSLWASLSDYVFRLLEDLGLSEEQIGQLRFERWTGDDIIVSVPWIPHRS